MAKKRKTKKSKNTGSVDCCPMPENESQSVRIRKIGNGYIVSKSSSGPKGYKDEELYTPKKPTIDMQVRQAKVREKRLKNVSI